MRAAGCAGSAAAGPGPGAPGGEGAGSGPADQTCPSRLLRVPAAPSRLPPPAEMGPAGLAPAPEGTLGLRAAGPAHRPPAGPALPELPAGNAPRRRARLPPPPPSAPCPGQPRPAARPEQRRCRGGGTAPLGNASSPLELPVLPPSVVVARSNNRIRTVWLTGLQFFSSGLFDFCGFNMLCIREHMFT